MQMQKSYPRTDNSDGLDTLEELASHLKVPKSWVYSRTRVSGPDAMPRIKVGKYLRFNRSEVLDWLKSRDDD